MCFPLPKAGEIVRPVVAQHMIPLTQRSPPPQRALPPVPVSDEVYTYEMEQVETELVFDIEELDDGDDDYEQDKDTLRDALQVGKAVFGVWS